jgi:hypothetical protein
MFDPDAHLPRINRGMVNLGACLIAGFRLAREKQVNVRVVPTSHAIEESVDLAHEIYNRVFGKVPEQTEENVEQIHPQSCDVGDLQGYAYPVQPFLVVVVEFQIMGHIRFPDSRLSANVADNPSSQFIPRNDFSLEDFGFILRQQPERWLFQVANALGQQLLNRVTKHR